MCLNWKRGKSEAILQFVGDGSMKEYERLTIGLQSQLDLGEGDCLRVVAVYRHMGSSTSHKASLGGEVRA
eukprot:5260991-Alexandrium_andersonii.AAC.1